MKNSIKLIIIALCIFKSSKGQNISLQGEIFEYATYYINSFNINTGATNVQIFRYQLSSVDTGFQEIKVHFKVSMISPDIGINGDQTIIEVKTDPFKFKNGVLLDNRFISSETTIIYDLDSPPNSIELRGQVVGRLDPSETEILMQSVMTTGKIPDGEYTFEVNVLSTNDQILASDSKIILVQSPVAITLESPAGALSDTLENTIFTTFPIFQWFSQICNGCVTYIRVAKFNPTIHSSMEDAMEDQRVLPFDQSIDWYQIDNINSFQYPFSGAYPLEEGSVYCWQVLVKSPTTSGSEQMLSSIASFKIGQAGNIELDTMMSNPILMALKQVLGENQYNSLFGSGRELSGYNPTGQISVNDAPVDQSELTNLLNQIISNTYQIQSVRVD